MCLKFCLFDVPCFSFRFQRGLGPDAQPGSLFLKQTTRHPNLRPEDVSQIRTLGP